MTRNAKNLSFAIENQPKTKRSNPAQKSVNNCRDARICNEYGESRREKGRDT